MDGFGDADSLNKMGSYLQILSELVSKPGGGAQPYVQKVSARTVVCFGFQALRADSKFAFSARFYSVFWLSSASPR